MLSKVITFTTSAYDKACDIVGHSRYEVKLLYDEGKISKEELQHISDKIDSTYRDLLCKLPTNVLSAILEEHEKKIIRRATTTLDAIHTELLERELLNEKKGAD